MGRAETFDHMKGERTRNRGNITRPVQDEVHTEPSPSEDTEEVASQQIKIKIRTSPTNFATVSKTNEVLMFWTIKATKIIFILT